MVKILDGSQLCVVLRPVYRSLPVIFSLGNARPAWVIIPQVWIIIQSQCYDGDKFSVARQVSSLQSRGKQGGWVEVGG